MLWLGVHVVTAILFIWTLILTWMLVLSLRELFSARMSEQATSKTTKELKQSSIAELTAAISIDENLASLLRRKIKDDNLALSQASDLIRAGLQVSVVFQLFDVWDRGHLSDGDFDEVLREAISDRQNRATKEAEN